MKKQSYWCALACAGVLWITHGTASAEIVRFRYVPRDACGNTALVPAVPGTTGERQSWVGGPIEPFYRTIQPTHIVTFVHAYTGQKINVPFTFPQGTAWLEHRPNRIIYNYGTY